MRLKITRFSASVIAQRSDLRSRLFQSSAVRLVRLRRVKTSYIITFAGCVFGNAGLAGQRRAQQLCVCPFPSSPYCHYGNNCYFVKRPVVSLPQRDLFCCYLKGL